MYIYRAECCHQHNDLLCPSSIRTNFNAVSRSWSPLIMSGFRRAQRARFTFGRRSLAPSRRSACRRRKLLYFMWSLDPLDHTIPLVSNLFRFLPILLILEHGLVALVITNWVPTMDQQSTHKPKLWRNTIVSRQVQFFSFSQLTYMCWNEFCTCTHKVWIIWWSTEKIYGLVQYTFNLFSSGSFVAFPYMSCKFTIFKLWWLDKSPNVERFSVIKKLQSWIGVSPPLLGSLLPALLLLLSWTTIYIALLIQEYCHSIR